jgi:hypothetical protein
MSFDPILLRRASIFVGASFQILEILEYACGYKLGAASIPVRLGGLNQNPIFGMASTLKLSGYVNNLRFFQANQLSCWPLYPCISRRLVPAGYAG